jgi:hypothetical protein
MSIGEAGGMLFEVFCNSDLKEMGHFIVKKLFH